MFDSLARLPLDSQLVLGAREVPLTVVVSRAAPRTATDALATHGAEVIVATGQNEPARVRSALDQLGADGVGSILLEGGPHLAGAFMDAGEVDEMRLFLAPMVLGGRTARDPLEGEGVDAIADAARALTLECERVGEDLLVSARIKEWYEGGPPMFTGLVQGIGSVAESSARRRRADHDRDAARGRASAGDSIAINGVCLTAVTLRDGSFAADAMNETLGRSSLGDLALRLEVNLELPLRATDRLGGQSCRATSTASAR